MGKNIDAMLANWKTTVHGLLVFLLSVPLFVSSIITWSHHQPVNWLEVIVAIGLAAGGSGLAQAKDASPSPPPVPALLMAQEKKDK